MNIITKTGLTFGTYAISSWIPSKFEKLCSDHARGILKNGNSLELFAVKNATVLKPMVQTASLVAHAITVGLLVPKPIAALLTVPKLFEITFDLLQKSPNCHENQKN